MRNALLALPVLASLLSLKPADACGPYGNFRLRLMRVTTHFADGGTRAFVITNQKVSDKQPWVRLAPMTYDYASVVDVENPEAAIDMTLVGPKGTKIVSSRERVYLSQTFVSQSPSVAFEIRAPKGEFSIAMAGKHSDAEWIELRDERRGKSEDIAWVKTQGLTPLLPEYVSVHKLEGTDFEAVTVLPKTGEILTFVRRGDVVYTQFEGTALGGLSASGERYVVAAKHGETPRAILI